MQLIESVVYTLLIGSTEVALNNFSTVIRDKVTPRPHLPTHHEWSTVHIAILRSWNALGPFSVTAERLSINFRLKVQASRKFRKPNHWASACERSSPVVLESLRSQTCSDWHCQSLNDLDPSSSWFWSRRQLLVFSRRCVPSHIIANCRQCLWHATHSCTACAYMLANTLCWISLRSNRGGWNWKSSQNYAPLQLISST